MFTPVFAISHGVRPISPGGARVARTARAALLSPRSGEKLGVLFRNRSIFVPRGLGDRSPVSNFGYIRAPGPPSRVHTIGPVLSIFWARAASDGALLRRSRGPKMPASRVGTGCRDVDIKGVRAQYIQSTDRPKTKTASSSIHVSFRRRAPGAPGRPLPICKNRFRSRLKKIRCIDLTRD